ncbi:MAG: hypothetical protein U9Q82_07135 [Chloroflexota bacterium]|nr:hypothetical protein [Chloroflexota bacterium]
MEEWIGPNEGFISFLNQEKYDLHLSDRDGLDVIQQNQEISPDTQIVTLPNGVQANLAQRRFWKGNQKVRLAPYLGVMFKLLIENYGRLMTHKELFF